MNFGDIVKLTVNGYSTDEIRELNKIAKETPEVLEYAKSGKTLTEVKSLIELTGELSQVDNPNEGPGEPGEKDQTPPENSNDDVIKENEELKKQIADMQRQNQFTDLSGQTPPDPLDDFRKCVADCM